MTDAKQAALQEAPACDQQDRAAFFAWWGPYQLPEYWPARIDVVAWHAWQAAMTHYTTKAVPQVAPVGAVQHLHELNDEWLAKLPIGTKLYAAPQAAPASPTAGMNIAQRIVHVGGRNNAAGYVEFGSIQAVEALVRQVLRDLPASQQDTLDADRYRWLRDENEWLFEPRLDAADGTIWRLTFYTPAEVIDVTDDDTLDAAIDAARAKEKRND